MDVKDLLRVLGELAPLKAQAAWDKSGVQVAGEIEDIRRVAVTLEPVPDILDAAVKDGAQMVVTHHPLTLKPSLPSIRNNYRAALKAMLSSGAWLYAAHTCLDAVTDGPATWLCQELGLANTTVLEHTHTPRLAELVFRPNEPLDRETATAFTDFPGVESIAQDRTGEVRLACAMASLNAVKAMLAGRLGPGTVFHMREMADLSGEYGIGLAGDLPEPMETDAFVRRVAELAGRKVLALAGPRPESVSRVAVCPGSGASLMAEAAAVADAYVTGDVKYHDAVEARCLVLDVGHFSLEEEMTRRFAAQLKEALPGDVRVDFLPGRDPFAWHLAEGNNG